MRKPATIEPVYDSVTRFFHWAVLALLLIEFPIAWTMPDVHKDTRPDGLIAWHLFFGSLILFTVVLRLLWRLTHAAPRLEPMPRWQELAAKATHGLLYLGLVALPFLGWANASSRGWDVKLLGIVPLPALSPPGSSWGRDAGDVHQTVAIILLILIGLHVLATLHHHWIRHDGTLQRMLPRRRRP